ncbi:HD domain-containing protein [Candidatus Bipolaricaulota bacterium]|nr:HD domain-containing protein [Candidatus Bipolaricaulota bacterium]
MRDGLRIGKSGQNRETAGKKSTTIELLVRRGSVEVIRQRIEAGKMFYLDEASEWEGFEFLYLLSGLVVLRNGDDEVNLSPGDYIYHHGLPERAYFRVMEESSLLLVASPPSYHMMRDEIQEMMALARSVEEKDADTEGHCRRIEGLSLRTGERLHMSDDDLTALSNAAYLHDVGKVCVPLEILSKPDALDPDELAEMQKHPIHGREMLFKTESLRGAAEMVAAHHERFDGTGYPAGRQGDEISLGARIIAVVDSYDAMTTDRPYRRGMSRAEACDELRRYAGTQFDPAVVEAFLEVLNDDQ